MIEAQLIGAAAAVAVGVWIFARLAREERVDKAEYEAALTRQAEINAIRTHIHRAARTHTPTLPLYRLRQRDDGGYVIERRSITSAYYYDPRPLPTEADLIRARRAMATAPVETYVHFWPPPDAKGRIPVALYAEARAVADALVEGAAYSFDPPTPLDTGP